MRSLRPVMRLLLGTASIAALATPAQAETLTTSVRGAGTVQGTSDLDTSPSLTCAGTAASTADAPAICSHLYPRYSDTTCVTRALPIPCSLPRLLVPQNVYVQTFAATGWTFSGFGDPPVAGNGTTSQQMSTNRTLVATFIDPAPTVAVDAPTPATGNIPLTVTATDDGKLTGGTVEVRDAGGAVVFKDNQAVLPFTSTWPADSLAPGAYTATATATDEGGVTGTSAARTITIPAPATKPTPAPSVAPTTPEPTAITGGGFGTAGDTSSSLPTASQAAALGRTSFRYVWASATTGTTTRFTRLAIRSVTPGAALRVICSGTGCPKQVRLKQQRGQRVATTLIGRALGAGATIEIRATKAGLTGQVVQLRTHAARVPTVADRCLAPGASKPTRC